MYYLIDISKKKFGQIVAKSEGLMAINFHRNFMIKTDQADGNDLLVVDVSYDDLFAMYGAQPWVASFDGPDDDDPWSAGDSEEEALGNFIHVMEHHHV